MRINCAGGGFFANHNKPSIKDSYLIAFLMTLGMNEASHIHPASLVGSAGN